MDPDKYAACLLSASMCVLQRVVRLLEVEAQEKACRGSSPIFESGFRNGRPRAAYPEEPARRQYQSMTRGATKSIPTKTFESHGT
jgi:hypothetical protein